MPEAPTAVRAPAAGSRARPALGESPRVRGLLIAVSLSFLALFLFLPLAAVFSEALRKGIAAYFASFDDPAGIAAIELSLIVVAVSVPLSAAFGLAAAWAVAKFEFRGKQLLIALIDLPFSVSPVIGGLIYVLLYGTYGWLGPWLVERDLQIIFAAPGIILATLFVTFPFVAREVIPLMHAQGTEQEQAALTLGAGGWQTFFRVTLPNVKWAVLYGVILCNARAMGEFGAVSVVSGHIRGKTNTMPLHVEILYNEYNFVAAFAFASLLALLALLTLGADGWQTFFRVTLPNVKWAVLYGVILCNARAMGEFGAVSVVSGHIRGKTNTMPLHVEILYNEYNFVAAFAFASLLALLALLTLAAKSAVEWRAEREQRHAQPVGAAAPAEALR